MPLLYRGMHAARFEGWKGELDHDGYLELIGSIRDRVGKAKGPKLSEQQAEEKLAETASEAVRTIVANTAEKTRPISIREKYSAAPISRAHRPTSGPKKATIRVEMMPPTNDAIAAVASAGPARPWRAIW